MNESSNVERHKVLMERLKLLPIFRCAYCALPHPSRYCSNRETP